MNYDERLDSIYSIIQRRSQISVDTLSKMTGLSQVSIRRYLKRLEEAELIIHTYGAARVTKINSIESSFHQRAASNLEAKQKIANIAARYIMDNQSIFIDGSSTAIEIIKALPSNKKITVYTNSLAALPFLFDKENVRIFVLGGYLAPDNNTFESSHSIELLRDIFIDAVFISCSGFSIHGFTNNGLSGTAAKRIMLENSAKNYLIADCSKWKKHGLFELGTWEKINTIITDQPIPDQDLACIEKCGTEVVWF